jgi:hypothetical protein
MAICGCGSPACYCQPAVAGGFIYADLRGELSTHLAPQALFAQILLCVSLCYKLSPFQVHSGRWHCTSFLRPACLLTVHMGSGSSPLSYGVFLPLSLLQAFPLLVAGRGVLPPLLPSLASLFICSSVKDFPSPPLRCSGRPALFAMCLFHCYCLLFSFNIFFFFPWVGVSLSRGLCWSVPGCLWEYHMPLSSPCGLRLPKWSLNWCLAAAPFLWSPTWGFTPASLMLLLLCILHITTGEVRFIWVA